MKAIVFDAYGTLYDVQSVAAVTEAAYPGFGELITQIWRIKQLEYSWLRSLMQRYEDFNRITVDALKYTLATLGLPLDNEAISVIIEKYLWLDPYPETRAALDALASYDLAILSNGSPAMLADLVRNTGLDRQIGHVISIDAARTYKPSPRAYALIEAKLGTAPSEVLFVSSNPFDVCGAKSFGLEVAWVDRLPPEAMAAACRRSDLVTPLTMFRALRQQMDELGCEPDHSITSLADLPGLVGSQRSRGRLKG